MNWAIGVTVFALALLVPFVDGLYVGALGIAAFAALIIWVWARQREQQIEADVERLQVELSEFVRQINAEDGK